jgi:hypothetical protein
VAIIFRRRRWGDSCRRRCACVPATSCDANCLQQNHHGDGLRFDRDNPAANQQPPTSHFRGRPEADCRDANDHSSLIVLCPVLMASVQSLPVARLPACAVPAAEPVRPGCREYRC